MNLMQGKFYRNWVQNNDLVGFEVKVKETDLFIRADRDLTKEASALIKKYRQILENYISKTPVFSKSLIPLDVKPQVSLFIREMAVSSKEANVGPMASVAGAMAEFVGKELLNFSREIIVENGGDIFLKTLRNRTIAIYAGESPLSGKIGVEVTPSMGSVGVCTSSGKVGHSLSFGNADSVTVISKSTALADAWATSLANRIKNSSDIQKTIEYASAINSVVGVVIIADDKIGFAGKINILKV